MKIEQSIVTKDGTKVSVSIEADNAKDFPILRTSTLDAMSKAIRKLADWVKTEGSNR